MLRRCFRPGLRLAKLTSSLPIASSDSGWRQEESRWRSRHFVGPALAFGFFGSVRDDDDPFQDLDKVFQEFFSRSFNGNPQVFSYSWDSRDGSKQGLDPFSRNTLQADPESLFHAAALDDVDAIRRLGKRKNVEEKHKHGWTPLHVAAFHGNIRSLKALLDLGADVNTKDEFTTAMHIGEESGVEPREVLIERQQCFGVAMPHNYNFRGSTALHYAVLGRSKDAVSLLVEAGADVLLKNDEGKTPIQFAKAIKDPELLTLLNQAAKKQEAEKAIREAEERRKFPLHLRLKQRLVGQEVAINTVASAIRRKENGW